MAEKGMDRRSLFASAAGGLTLAAVGAPTAAAAAKAKPAPMGDVDGVCFLNPDVVDGPYYIQEQHLRSDITEGKPGIPLEIRVRFVDAACRPIKGARIDTWQSDAQGIYSNIKNQGDNLDIATLGQTYLRGTQITDDDGRVTFKSIFPGWYRARTPHIHFKLYTNDINRFTGQAFFPDAMSEYIFNNVPLYQRALVRDTVNATDWILAAATRHAMFEIREELDRYVASITFGVNPVATPAPGGKMPCPPEPQICAPIPQQPALGAKRVAELIPGPDLVKMPVPQIPPLPPGWK